MSMKSARKMYKVLRERLDRFLADDRNIMNTLRAYAAHAWKRVLYLAHHWQRYYSVIILLLVIVIGSLVRISYTKTGLPYVHYWDEPKVVWHALQIMKTGDWNPHYFNYPSLSIYLQIPLYVTEYFRLMHTGGLVNLDNIVFDEMQITHPSFHFIGRLSMALLFMLSAVLLYSIGRTYFNEKIGLLSAIIFTFLRGDDWSVIFTSPNIPTTFFVLLTLFCLTFYITAKDAKSMIITGLVAGLAVACKYNCFPVLVPVFLAIMFYGTKKTRDCIIAGIAPFAGFFMGCPFAFFDFKTFLHHAGFEVRHYGYTGHPYAELTPGKEHLKGYTDIFQGWIMNGFHNISAIRYIPLFGGITAAIKDIRNFLIVFSYPLVYVIFMSRQKTFQIQNMVSVMPFIALLVAIGFYYIFKALMFPFNYNEDGKFKRFRANEEKAFMVFAILFLVLCFNPVGLLRERYDSWKHYKETRTQAVEFIRDNYAGARIVIANELRIHPMDLAKLPDAQAVNIGEYPLSDLHPGDFVVSSDNFVSLPHDKTNDKYIEDPNRLNALFPKETIVKTFGSGILMCDMFSVEPKINIYKINKQIVPHTKSPLKPVSRRGNSRHPR